MKFAAICGILLAIAIPVAGWLAYRDIARLHDLGSEGTLRMLAKIGELRGYHGSVTRIYDATLADARVRVKTVAILEAGAEIQVLYIADGLKSRSPSDYFNDGVDYVAGRKSEAKNDILVREMGGPSIWLIAVFEAVIIAASVWLLAKKMPNHPLEPTSIAVTPPATQEPRRPYSRLI